MAPHTLPVSTSQAKRESTVPSIRDGMSGDRIRAWRRSVVGNIVSGVWPGLLMMPDASCLSLEFGVQRQEVRSGARSRVASRVKFVALSFVETVVHIFCCSV